ncbi:MAG: tail fiber protein [Desulfovibrionaceae bacterium]|nr:tail fiber protein [Desulfovibrionaceae bacterium]MBF0515106.1 tail fiber protein [Desulfovibrionaceae bacterium]
MFLRIVFLALMLAAMPSTGMAVSVDGTSFDPTTVSVAILSPPRIGSLIIWATNTPPPDYLECNGALLSQTTYADLFNAIGCTYDCTADSFYLPDWRGYFPRGIDHGAGRDPERGPAALVGSTQSWSIVDHNHGLWGDSYGLSPGGASYNLASIPAGSASIISYTTTLGQFYPPNFFQNMGGSLGSEERPINRAVMFCIKYR